MGNLLIKIFIILISTYCTTKANVLQQQQEKNPGIYLLSLTEKTTRDNGWLSNRESEFPNNMKCG